jgi:hypothetical protein
MSKKDAGTHRAPQSRACRGHGDSSGGGADARAAVDERIERKAETKPLETY